jgi:hypothetical protein
MDTQQMRQIGLEAAIATGDTKGKQYFLTATDEDIRALFEDIRQTLHGAGSEE